MKLSIGDNIRKFRKKNDLTQEELADKLGVSYQSVSRWENGFTYPDIEFLPAIAEMLSCSVDVLMGIPDAEKKKKAEEAFDELRRECMRHTYDTERIVSIIRDIRRNYMDSDTAWRPWCEGNDRAFCDPKVLPEVRLMAEAYLEKHPMSPSVIETMAYIEDEEHLSTFLEKYTTSYDCSERELLFNRYYRLLDHEKLEPERRYMFYKAVSELLYPRVLIGLDNNPEKREASYKFRDSLLSLVRDTTTDNKPDMWTEDRMNLGFERAERFAAMGEDNEALGVLTDCVELLEGIMKITDEVLLPTSCRWLEGMEWRAKEDWHRPGNNPDLLEERIIFIWTTMGNLTTCYCVFPSQLYELFSQKCFDSLRNEPRFMALSTRVKELIVTRPNQGK